MLNSNLPEPELLKVLLEPLLDDFEHWFTQARSLLETEEIPSLGTEGQADLLARVEQAQQEVKAAQSLFRATGGQAGIAHPILMHWHQLVIECWRVMIAFRLGGVPKNESGI